MATRSSILAWEILARGASWATVRGAAESDTHTLIIQMKIALIKKKNVSEHNCCKPSSDLYLTYK